MKVLNYFLIGILLSMPCTILNGQSVANNEPISSKESGLMTINKNLSNGTFSEKIDLAKIPLEGGKNIDVSLNYSSGNGIPVNQYHGKTGLGWSIGGNHKITVDIKGVLDIYKRAGSSTDPGSYYNSISNNSTCIDIGRCDAERDIFTVNLLGQTINFTSTTGGFRTIPSDLNIKIEETFPSNDVLLENNRFGFNIFYSSGHKTFFKITDQFGYEYHFGGEGYVGLSSSYNHLHTQNSLYMEAVPTTWYLQKIITPLTRQEVTFIYEEEIYYFRSNISNEQRAVQDEFSDPENNYYQPYEGIDRYTTSFNMTRRLEEIQYDNTTIDYEYTFDDPSVLADFDSEAKMLAFVSFKENGEDINRYWLKYDQVTGIGNDLIDSYNLDRNILLLKEFKQFATDHLSNDNYTTKKYEFNYHRENEIPRRVTTAFDFWGYYNGAFTNNTLIPDIYTDFGQEIHGLADKRAKEDLAKNGLLSEIILPGGGSKKFEYEPQIVSTNNIEISTEEQVIGLNNPNSIEYTYSVCDDVTGWVFEESLSITRSDFEFTIDGSGTNAIVIDNLKTNGYYNEYCQGTETVYYPWILYEHNGVDYDVIQYGTTELVDLTGRTAGMYKIDYASTEMTILNLIRKNLTNTMQGAGVRIASIESSDNDTNYGDDVIVTFSYLPGEWGYSFLPSIEANFDASNNYNINDPLIPAINNGPNNSPAYQFVISTFSTSPYRSFLAPVYYESVIEEIVDIHGYTEHTFVVPSEFGSECEFYSNSSSIALNNLQTFVNGGMSSFVPNGDSRADKICYSSSTPLLSLGQIKSITSYGVADPIGQPNVYHEVNEKVFNYELISGSSLSGEICKSYVKDQLFNFFWDLVDLQKTTLCSPYTINLDFSRIESVVTTEDDVTIVEEFDYIYNFPHVLASKTRYCEAMPNEQMVTEYKYPFYPSEFSYPSVGFDEKLEMIERNILETPLETIIYHNGIPISGSKVDFKLFPNSLNQEILVQEYIYDFDGSEFYVSSLANDWYDDGSIKSMYTGLQGTTPSNPLNSSYYSEFPIIYEKDGLYASTSYKDRINTTTHISNGLLANSSDHSNNTVYYQYDDLSRMNKIIESDQTEVDFKYSINPFNKTSEIIKEDRFFDSNIYDVRYKTTHDGLGRFDNEQKSYLLSGTNTVQDQMVTQEQTYNAAGNLLELITPGKGKVVNLYDNSILQRKTGQSFVSEDGDSFTRYISKGTNDQVISITNHLNETKLYPSNSLIKSESIDEFGNISIEYKTIFGQIVKQTKYADANTELSTYFSYDDHLKVICEKPVNGEPTIYTYANSGINNSSTHKLASILIPGKDNPSEFRYDKKGRTILEKDGNGTTIGYVYDDYNQLIKKGIYNGNWPIDIIFNADIEQDLSLLSVTIYDGTNQELPYHSEHTEYIINSDNQIDPNYKVVTTKNNDYLGRPISINYQNHLGFNESITDMTYNAAGNLIYSDYEISTIDGDYSFSIQTYYNEKQLLEAELYNNQVVNKYEYDGNENMNFKHFHEVGAGSNNYLYSSEYGYDGYGRLVTINDLSEISFSINDDKPILCNYELSLGHLFQVFSNISIDYINKDGYLRNFDMANFDLEINNETSKSEFIDLLLAEVVTLGYIIDDIYFDENKLIFLQTNFAAEGFRFANDYHLLFNKSTCCQDNIIEHLFAQRLEYEGSLVKENHWSSVDGPIHNYTYHYDQAGRLLVANHAQKQSFADSYVGDNSLTVNVNNYDNTYYTQQVGNYSTSYNYDEYGNILNLSRRGLFEGSNTFGLIDKLDYSYYGGESGNLNLGTVRDYSEREEGFWGLQVYDEPDQMGNLQTVSAASIGYDSNGNVYSHSAVYGGQIWNNSINKPRLIKSDTHDLRAEYLSDGKLVSQEIIHTENGQSVDVIKRDFSGLAEYRDGELFSISYAGSRIIIPKTSTDSEQFEYTISDYKGQPRVRFTDYNNDQYITVNEILNVKNYYPFGLEWSDHKDDIGLYNGSTYQNMDKANEFGFYFTRYRTLDPYIGRWLQTDPAAIQLSDITPYNSMMNNPVMFSDENGDFVQAISIGITIAVAAIKSYKYYHNHKELQGKIFNEFGGTIDLPTYLGAAILDIYATLVLGFVGTTPGSLITKKLKTAGIHHRLIKDFLSSSINKTLVAIHRSLEQGFSKSEEGPLEETPVDKFVENLCWGIIHSASYALTQELYRFASGTTPKLLKMKEKGVNPGARRVTRMNLKRILNGKSPKPNIPENYFLAVSNAVKPYQRVIGASWQLFGTVGTGWRNKLSVSSNANSSNIINGSLFGKKGVYEEQEYIREWNWYIESSKVLSWILSF